MEIDAAASRPVIDRPGRSTKACASSDERGALEKGGTLMERASVLGLGFMVLEKGGTLMERASVSSTWPVHMAVAPRGSAAAEPLSSSYSMTRTSRLPAFSATARRGG